MGHDGRPLVACVVRSSTAPVPRAAMRRGMPKLSPLLAFVAIYALLYAGFGMQSPFVPALLRERGLQAQDLTAATLLLAPSVGNHVFVLAAAMVVRVIAGPIVAHAADLAHRHTVLLFACAALAAISVAAVLQHRGRAATGAADWPEQVDGAGLWGGHGLSSWLSGLGPSSH